MRSVYSAAGMGLLALFSACGGDERPENIGEPSKGGRGGTANLPRAGSSTGGGEGGEGGAQDTHDPLAPVVTITAPAEVLDPNQGEVLVAANVEVTCLAKQSEAEGSNRVSASSVAIAILDADGEVTEAKPGTPTGNADEYSNTFSLTALPAGSLGFRCAAEDTEKRAGNHVITTFLDKGPSITITTPEAESFFPLTSLLEVEFTVEAVPLTDDDEGAPIDQVTLDVAGVAIDLSDAEVSPGSYRLEINLTDPALFSPVPNGPLPVTVEASNSRAPEPVVARVTRQTAIDGAGPVINLSSPADKAVVGGNVRLVFGVTDAVSGVDPASVTVTLNGTAVAYDPNPNSPWSYANGNFTYEFDSRQVKDSEVQITVNVGARDTVGNASGVVSRILYLDNYPPLVDLDPTNVRSARLQGNNLECSMSFDPLGAALGDLDVVGRAGIFRAFVWERTNSLEGIPVLHYSGTDQSSVRLYLRAASGAPLLVDKNNDGLCDDVSDVESDSALRLDPVPKGGTPWFGLGDEDAAPAVAALGCVLREGTKPQDMCTSQASDMWQVVEHAIREPAVYARSPTPGLECTGIGWEFGALLNADGWVCSAARVVDRAGNVGISRPMRLCVDDPSRAGVPACATSSIDAPSCTDGCTPPQRVGNFGILLQ